MGSRGVRGQRSERIGLRIDGVAVLQYRRLQIGGGSGSNCQEAVSVDGRPLEEGAIRYRARVFQSSFRGGIVKFGRIYGRKVEG